MDNVIIQSNPVSPLFDLSSLVDVPVRDGGGDEVALTLAEEQRAVDDVRSALNRWAYEGA